MEAADRHPFGSRTGYPSWRHLIVLLTLCAGVSVRAQTLDSVFLTNGFKIGEVTDSSIVVWTRLCLSAKPVPVSHARQESTFRHPIGFDNSMPVARMDGAVPGTFGEVRIKLTSADTSIVRQWHPVSPYRDYTFKTGIGGLRPATSYTVVVEGRKADGGPVSRLTGKFRTAPRPEAIVPVTFTASTCQYFWSHDDPIRGFRMYDSMLALEPAFHCQTGDYVYYDKPGPLAVNLPLARHKWNAINGWPALVEFYNHTPLYIQKDDHDLLKDDVSDSAATYGELTFGDGQRIWEEQTPIGNGAYRTVRWGKDLQVWITEGRDFRSDNTDADGPDKTILGREQIEWLKSTVRDSDATFKVLVSSTPVVGPDRDRKTDNHANDSHRTEGEWLRRFLADAGMFVINGDRHWQYVSVDPRTGLREFSQGPSSDSHAQGWTPDDRRPEHKFLRVNGGFLSVSVRREGGTPIITFTHHDVEGTPVHREMIRAE
ncbi:alkaline phosphatase [Lewinella sp. JB7]|uniref:alkaline phosphatase D family protein n=1 Tax=Lewinella sp. JB7 TaxID=2962887 RepID=UPI0020C99A65|nr:alkaline phosphatase D family protein [Lewinella sp. JB7]MCP9237802.1 alkaline phosphatase D family protein [Lewinella sp. JB7]